MLLLLTSCSKEVPVHTIGSGGSLGNYSKTARAIARVVNQRQEANAFRLEHVETAGSVSNIEAILSGEAPFGLTQADVEYQAVKGISEWKERGPQSDLRAMFSLYTDSITVVATPASGARTTRDLIGKRIDIGHPDSGGRRNAIDALDAIGVDWRAGSTILEESADDRSSRYLHGELDAFFQTVGHPTMDILFAVNSVPGARLIELDNIEGLLAKHPYYAKSVIPVALYPGVANPEDVETVGIRTLFVTSAHVSEDVVYAVTRAVFEDVQALGRYDPVLKDLTKPRMLEGATAPLHPGAARYFEEVGLGPAP
jgi:TRAP transporter TAXI family solute receptor